MNGLIKTERNYDEIVQTFLHKRRKIQRTYYKGVLVKQDTLYGKSETGRYGVKKSVYEKFNFSGELNWKKIIKGDVTFETNFNKDCTIIKREYKNKLHGLQIVKNRDGIKIQDYRFGNLNGISFFKTNNGVYTEERYYKDGIEQCWQIKRDKHGTLEEALFFVDGIREGDCFVTNNVKKVQTYSCGVLIAERPIRDYDEFIDWERRLGGKKCSKK